MATPASATISPTETRFCRQAKLSGDYDLSTKFICDRTQLRPRDIIAYFNIVLDEVSGATDITPRVILAAEATYSRKRFDALRHEWASIHPRLDIYLEALQERTGRIDFTEFCTPDNMTSICLRLGEEQHANDFKDEVVRRFKALEETEDATHRRLAAQALVATLYKVGAVELKLNRGDPFQTCYTGQPTINMNEVGNDTVFRVAPMLWRVLGITPNIG